jgi:competence protein ComEC
VLARLASRPWTKASAGASAVLLVLAIAWWRALPDGRLHVTMLDVGQGDAIFVVTPSGRQVLVDGGPSESVLLRHLGRHMPFWDRTLDMVILTHPDLDHLTGLLTVLERYQVATVVFREVGAKSPEYGRWLDLVVAEGAEVYSGEVGLGIVLDGDLEVSVLHPGAEMSGGASATHNNASIVLRLRYGALSFLLPGDIEATVERDLIEGGAPLASTVLKAAHHGSCTSTTEGFLEAVAPDLVVISVGENDFGHPCEGVLDRLRAYEQSSGSELPVYRTDEHGTVEVLTDGAQLWVRTER